MISPLTPWARRGVLGVFTRIYLIGSLTELGEFSKALRYSEEAVEIARSANHVYSLAFSYYGIGTVLALRGDVSQSIDFLEQGLELCQSWTLPLMLPLIGTSLGYAYCLADRVDEAIVLLEETEREASTMHRLGGHAMTLVRLGEAYLRNARIADAERTAPAAGAAAFAQTGRVRPRGPRAPVPCRTRTERSLLARRERDEFSSRRSEERRNSICAPWRLNVTSGSENATDRPARAEAPSSTFERPLPCFGNLGMQFWLEQAQSQLASPS